MNDKIRLHELLALGQQLEAAGHPHPVFAKAAALNSALDQAIRPDRFTPPTDVLDMDPADLGDILLKHATAIVVEETAHRRAEAFEHAILGHAQRVLSESSDDIIVSMRKEFDPALKVLINAHKLEITPETNAAEIIKGADAKTIKAYNEIPAATATLDRIAKVRVEMALVGGVGPSEPVIANFVSGPVSGGLLKSAQTIYQGKKEWTQVNGPFGTNHVLRPAQRLGGAWLELVGSGIEVNLNTDSEARAVLAGSGWAPELRHVDLILQQSGMLAPSSDAA